MPKQKYQPVLVGNKNAVPVSSIPNAATSGVFGESTVGALTPFIQASASYNLLPANMRTFTATGGSAVVTGKEFVVTTGTSVGGYGVVRSLRSVNYKGGQGAVGRFSARFTTGVANSQQGVGFFNIGDGLLFGYNGNTFGIIYQHGGKPEVRLITVTGASAGSTNLTLTLNGVAYTIPLTSGTTEHNAFEIEQWLKTNQTVWQATQNGATVVIMALSDGAKSGSYTYSHGSSTGTIAQTTAGITKTTDFIARTAWNVDTVGWLDPTKGNVYEIQYQYLGYGSLEFLVEDPDTGRFVLVHRIKYANSFTTPSLGNPSLHCGIYVASLGSTTNLTAAMGSCGAFIQGTPARTRNPRALSNVKSVSTTLTNIFTLRNRITFGGEANQVEFEPDIVTAFTESVKGATIAIYANPTLGGETNYSYMDQNTLVTEYDTSATTVTGGIPIMQFVIPGNSAAHINLSELRIRIPPSLYLTFSANVNSGAAADTGISCSYYEDL